MENRSSPPSSPSSSSSSSDEHEKRQRQLSIQDEPKALFGKEMNLAREAALDVINNNSEEEALKIFLKGLEPAVEAPVRLISYELSSDSDDDEDEEEYL